MQTGKEAFPQGSFNTLVQSGTTDFDNFSQIPETEICGTGTDASNKQALKGRAKRKMITDKMIFALIEVAEKRGEPERKKAYRNAFYCQRKLVSHEGRIYGKYCKNRFCTLCCSIRKAEIINKYLPVIGSWEDPHFVTLTIRSVGAEKLPRFLYGIQRAFRQIREKHKKMNQRGTGLRLIGIKSLECNFNPMAKTYNPHLHLIVPNEETAKTLVDEWLKKWTKKFTSPLAQKMERVEGIERVLIEIIKYGSKIFTEPDLKKGANSKIPPIVYAAALDTIFTAMQKYRMFERFGFNLPKSSYLTTQPTIINNYEEWIFNPALHDWHNPESGELLTGYIPPPMLQFLLSQNIDTNLR